MAMSFHRISDLVAELSSAIWRRRFQDASFDLWYHLTHPEDYRPTTEEELRAWALLTAPENYDALCAFVEERRKLPNASSYALTIDNLLLRDAARRGEHGLANNLTPEQLADLIASLQSLK